MSGPCCDTCVYCVYDPEEWHRSLWRGEEPLPRCANDPRWPGVLHEVPGTACPNYRRKPTLPEGDGVRLLPLADGGYVWVDAADYERLSRYHWRLLNGYPCRQEKGRAILLHREIMQAPADKLVDHIDGNRRHACRSNLRLCTHEENHGNQRKRRTGYSRFKGVTFYKANGKWQAHCRFQGRLYHLGYFENEVEAARAYDYAAAKYFGEFACVNFPREWPPERRAEVHAEYLRAAAGEPAGGEGMAHPSPAATCRCKTG